VQRVVDRAAFVHGLTTTLGSSAVEDDDEQAMQRIKSEIDRFAIERGRKAGDWSSSCKDDEARNIRNAMI